MIVTAAGVVEIDDTVCMAILPNSGKSK